MRRIEAITNRMLQREKNREERKTRGEAMAALGRNRKGENPCRERNRIERNRIEGVRNENP